MNEGFDCCFLSRGEDVHRHSARARHRRHAVGLDSAPRGPARRGPRSPSWRGCTALSRPLGRRSDDRRCRVGRRCAGSQRRRGWRWRLARAGPRAEPRAGLLRELLDNHEVVVRAVVRDGLGLGCNLRRWAGGLLRWRLKGGYRSVRGGLRSWVRSRLVSDHRRWAQGRGHHSWRRGRRDRHDRLHRLPFVVQLEHLLHSPFLVGDEIPKRQLIRPDLVVDRAAPASPPDVLRDEHEHAANPAPDLLREVLKLSLNMNQERGAFGPGPVGELGERVGVVAELLALVLAGRDLPERIENLRRRVPDPFKPLRDSVGDRGSERARLSVAELRRLGCFADN